MIIGNVLREYKITFGDMIREEEAALSLPAELLQNGMKLRLIKARNMIMGVLIKVRRKTTTGDSLQKQDVLGMEEAIQHANIDRACISKPQKADDYWIFCHCVSSFNKIYLNRSR